MFCLQNQMQMCSILYQKGHNMIYKGTEQIKDIYIGGEKIKEIYKGSELVYRKTEEQTNV